jgi:hypothetical protein
MASYLDYLFPPQQQQPVAGLLGEEDIKRNQQMAQRAGLLNTGLGIIAASGPSRMPQGNILQSIAPGIMAGQQAYQGTLEQQQKQLAERAKALQEDSVVLPEGGTLVGKRTGTTLAQGAPKPVAEPAKIAEFNAAKGQGLIDPNMSFQQYQMMSRPPGTSVNVNMGEKNLFEIDKGVVENLTNQAVSARQFATSATQINNLLKGKGGGALVKVGAELARNLGIESETATANDLAKSLVVQTAVKVRPPGSGATSNIEFEAYISAVPSLANSEGGRNLMADANARFAARSEKIADFSRDLYKKGQFNLTAVQEYDAKLGPVLPKTFYDQVEKRKPAQAPARGVKFLGFE